MFETRIFESYAAFRDTCEKEAVNGVSREFAERNPNYEEDNRTNVWCWDCCDCDNCIACENCVSCSHCSYCSSLIESFDSRECMRGQHLNKCYEAKDCTRCSECSEVQHCVDCKRCFRSDNLIRSTDCSHCRDCTDCVKCNERENTHGARVGNRGFFIPKQVGE